MLGHLSSGQDLSHHIQSSHGDPVQPVSVPQGVCGYFTVLQTGLDSFKVFHFPVTILAGRSNVLNLFILMHKCVVTIFIKIIRIEVSVIPITSDPVIGLSRVGGIRDDPEDPLSIGSEVHADRIIHDDQNIGFHSVNLKYRKRGIAAHARFLTPEPLLGGDDQGKNDQYIQEDACLFHHRPPGTPTTLR